jgi:hypothetical protein
MKSSEGIDGPEGTPKDGGWQPLRRWLASLLSGNPWLAGRSGSNQARIRVQRKRAFLRTGLRPEASARQVGKGMSEKVHFCRTNPSCRRPQITPRSPQDKLNSPVRPAQQVLDGKAFLMRATRRGPPPARVRTLPGKSPGQGGKTNPSCINRTQV